jgi:DNA-directed RNA polymerase sigma subunit (sigma70/sigma32)
MIEEEKMTLTAVAQFFNITKQRVQQIYKNEKKKHENV